MVIRMVQSFMGRMQTTSPCPACGGLFLKERIHILVKASQTVVAANRFQYDGKMGEPNQLNSLQESLRSKFRHPAAVFRHGQNLFSFLMCRINNSQSVNAS